MRHAEEAAINLQKLRPMDKRQRQIVSMEPRPSTWKPHEELREVLLALARPATRAALLEAVLTIRRNDHQAVIPGLIVSIGQILDSGADSLESWMRDAERIGRTLRKAILEAETELGGPDLSRN